VHHGGAGTTAQAARAGVPQVVIPHMFDQHYWARRVHALGVAGPPLPAAFTADALVAAIEAALSPASLSASSSVAERVRASRGVSLAADWIENEARGTGEPQKTRLTTAPL
jgi:vancomycin aglycone glucosyltransferase